MKIQIDKQIKLWTTPIKGFTHFMDLINKENKKEDGKEVSIKE